jgi:hypothetical protein
MHGQTTMTHTIKIGPVLLQQGDISLVGNKGYRRYLKRISGKHFDKLEKRNWKLE